MLKFCFRYALYLLMTAGFSSAWAGVYEDFFKAVSFDDARSVSQLLERGFVHNAQAWQSPH